MSNEDIQGNVILSQGIGRTAGGESKPGIKTSEFYSANGVAGACLYLLHEAATGAIAIAEPVQIALTAVAGVAVVAYSASRAWCKHRGG